MIQALKRLNIYFKEMYPIIPRLILGYMVFAEIYFIVLLNSGANVSFEVTNGLNVLFNTSWTQNGILFDGIKLFHIGIEEIICGFTVFSFLCWLRIADDFKDYELDCRLFAHRPLPSGRVHKKDLIVFVSILIATTLLLNFLFMPNFLFCLILYIYGSLMAVWFFQKHKIAKSLPLALVTHNPVQMIMNIYIISFVIIKFSPFVKPISIYTVLAVFTLYFPALIWEVSRKIRAPKEETEYVTYSKLFGYKKSINFVLIITWIDIITNFVLVWNLNKISILLLLLNVIWMTWKFIEYKKEPTKYRIVTKVEKYTYIQESIMIFTIIVFLIFGKI